MSAVAVENARQQWDERAPPARPTRPPTGASTCAARPGRARPRRAEPASRPDLHARRARRGLPRRRPLAARRPRLAPGGDTISPSSRTPRSTSMRAAPSTTRHEAPAAAGAGDDSGRGRSASRRCSSCSRSASRSVRRSTTRRRRRDAAPPSARSSRDAERRDGHRHSDDRTIGSEYAIRRKEHF